MELVLGLGENIALLNQLLTDIRKTLYLRIAPLQRPERRARAGRVEQQDVAVAPWLTTARPPVDQAEVWPLRRLDLRQIRVAPLPARAARPAQFDARLAHRADGADPRRDKGFSFAHGQLRTHEERRCKT